MKSYTRPAHVILTSHANQVFKESTPIKWGAKDPQERGPVIATISSKANRNAIGSHSGSYTVYRALSIASGSFPQDHIPDLTNTSPTVNISTKGSWFDGDKIISLDPWGASINEVYRNELEQGYNIQPSIAITQAHLTLPEIYDAVDKGRLIPDDKILKSNKDVFVTKVAIEPVWYLPGIAKRFGIAEGELRKILFQETGGMFPELVTRPDLKILLPPIGSTTAYIFGDIDDLADENKELTCRVHDECNGSDVFWLRYLYLPSLPDARHRRSGKNRPAGGCRADRLFSKRRQGPGRGHQITGLQCQKTAKGR